MMRPVQALLLVLAMLAAGCSDLPNIQAGSCGNGVVDIGEDCDGASDMGEGTACGEPDSGEATACFLVCTDDSVCPADWACGDDGRCRRPTGELRPAAGSPWEFPVNSFGVGDVDGDGHADLIGDTATTLTIRYGDEGASFPDVLDVFSRAATGRLTLADLSNDGRTDVIVPIGGGLFTYLGTEDRELEPVAYAPIDFGSEAVRALPMPVESIYESTTLFIAGEEIYLENPSTGERSVVLDFPGPDSAADIQGRVLAVEPALDSDSPLDPVTPGGKRLRTAMAIGGTDRTWIIQILGTVGSPEPTVAPEDPLLLPTGWLVSGQGAKWGDLDGEQGYDVIVDGENASGTIRSFVFFRETVLGFYDPVPVNIEIDGSSETVDRVLAAGFLDGDDVQDIISPQGAFKTCNSQGLGCAPTVEGQLPNALFPTGATPTGGEWNHAELGDFNGDGAQDFAVTVAGAQGVFVYLNGDPEVGIFNRFVVATEDEPKTLRVGDFDGDLIDDLAFVERTEEGDKLWVTFGSVSGGMSEAIFTAKLPSLESIEPALWPGAKGEQDLVDDLLAVVRTGEQRSLAVLRGSSSRRLVSPFTIDKTLDFTRVLVGQYTAGSGGNNPLDVFAVGLASAGPEASAGVGNSLWLAEGKGEGSLDASSLTSFALPEDLGFESRCSLWSTGDVDQSASGYDELVGFDSSVACRGNSSTVYQDPPNLLVAAATPGDETAAALTVAPVPDDQLRAVQGLELFDADNDGDLDAVSLFGGNSDDATAGTTAGSSGVGVYWNNDGELGNASSIVELGEVNLKSAAPMLLDEDSVPELLLLVDSQLLVSRLDVESRTFGTPEMVPGAGNSPLRRSFVVADLNGDGLQDVAILAGGQIEVLLNQPAPPLGGQGVVSQSNEEGE